MVTEAQKNANRENSKLSTGPENTEKTRANSLKHGLRAEKCFRKEDLECVNSVYDQLCGEYIPQGIVQKYLVRRMALNMCKLDKIEEDRQCRSRIDEINQKMGDNDTDEVLLSLRRDNEKKKTALAAIPYYTVPDEKDDLFQRYETAAENSFYKAFDKLRELQK